MTKFIKDSLAKILGKMLDIPANQFHPLVWISGAPLIGTNVYIGGFSELSCKNSELEIGDGCDIASFVSINCADSHKRTIGLREDIVRRPIKIGANTFIGSHSVIKGGAVIGNNCVVAAGSVVDPGYYPPFSLIAGNPAKVKTGYYQTKLG